MRSFANIRFTPHMIFGFAVILVGLLLLLDNLYLLEAEDFLRFWPILLIIIGLPRALQPAGSPGRLFGFALVFIGALLVIDKLHIFEFRFWDFWPILLVLLGIALLRRQSQSLSASSDRSANEKEGSSADSTFNATAIIGGQTIQNSSKDFRGGTATAIMGECKIDLRSASIKQSEAVLDVFAFWGGIEILVPDSWSVFVQGYPILGGIEDKSVPPKKSAEKRLIIKGYAIMGGVEIKN